MKINYKQSFVGSSVAFILATSCCWLPLLIVALGGATGLVGLSEDLENYSGLLMSLGVFFLIIGSLQYQKNRKTGQEVVLLSKITCPECGHQEEETMPTNACQYFYECKKCVAVLKPKPKDCCVYCSYGTVVCPPIQGEGCCTVEE